MSGRDGMVHVRGGCFRMGSADFYPEERPVRTVDVDDFWIDARPVTVGDFASFVDATGYVTLAERPLDPADYPEADRVLLVPGSLAFWPTRGSVDLWDWPGRSLLSLPAAFSPASSLLTIARDHEQAC